MGRLALMMGHGQPHKVEIKNTAVPDAISHAHSSFPSSGPVQLPQRIGSVFWLPPDHICLFHLQRWVIPRGMILKSYTRPIDGTIPVQALLYDDEQLLGSQEGAGIYDG